MENNVLIVAFDDDGSIRSLFDKELEQELLPPSERGNLVSVYEDDGDAWDFSLNYREMRPDHFSLARTEKEVDGPRAIVTHTYEYKKSQMQQQVVLTQGSRRIDFITRIVWNEPGKMVKTRFPLSITADEAVCGIQFGSIKRPTHSNTTWDMARDEVPAHKWVDISDGHYGAALLNDSKYGHRVKDNALELTLLRSVRYPGPSTDSSNSVVEASGYTDICEHSFTYSLYPHPGDYVE